ncbi:MAG TPA: hypothetical protein VMU42_05445 [Candidatus Sulfotelmatobacter sp.]|nr:hypothetical protein [Candidatus Sulfotelmatobacter sp.]
MIKKAAVILALGYLLAGCAPEGSKFIGFDSCSPGGATVWYVTPNAKGQVDTSSFSPANCKH